MGSTEILGAGNLNLREGGSARWEQHSESLETQVASCIQGRMGPSPTQSLLARCSSGPRVVGSRTCAHFVKTKPRSDLLG